MLMGGKVIRTFRIGRNANVKRYRTSKAVEKDKPSSQYVSASFLKYFEAKGHERKSSSSLVPPEGDNSILFTAAGMVQFKEKLARAEGGKACTVQRCLRAGGKQNDMQQVGVTTRHQTLFEMLGNFSFGDYGKVEAIDMAWEYLTQVLQLPRSRLRVTAHHEDT